MRNEQIIRQWRILAMLAGGRSRRLEDFEPIRMACDVSVKTIRRDIEALSDVPEFQITSYCRDGYTFWRMDGCPWLKVEPIAKICNKCNTMREPDEYYKNRLTADGLRSICMYCIRAYNEEWEKENRTRRNAYYRRYRTKNRRNRINTRRRQVYAQRKERETQSRT